MSKSRWETPQSIPLDNTSAGPSILAAGLWRCATSSLQTAFEEHLSTKRNGTDQGQINLRPSMHGSYLFTSPRLIKLTVHAIEEVDKARRQKLLRQIFTGYNASSDFPGMAFVDDLLEMYPDMRIILNQRRNANEWVTSANESLRFFSTWRYVLVAGIVPQSYWHWRLYRSYDKLAKRRFGAETDIWSERYYELHNKWVRDLAREHGRELLEWKPSMSWPQLCAFVGCDVPDKDFPKTNETAEIKKGRIMLMVRGLMVWTLCVGIFIGLLAFMKSRWLS